MENKYYTPTLEEFYIGFEYDYNEGSVLEPIWRPSVYHPLDFVLDSSYDSCEFDESEILSTRVKYLDKEDIESLGFIYDDCFRDGGTSVFYNQEETIALHFYGTNKIVESKLRVRLLRYTGNPSYQGCIFDGTIKNKSELVTLLKRLGIK